MYHAVTLALTWGLDLVWLNPFFILIQSVEWSGGYYYRIGYNAI